MVEIRKKLVDVDQNEFLVLISKGKRKITYLYGSVEKEKIPKNIMPILLTEILILL